MSTTSPISPDIAPAQALWVELVTRITTQPLHYRSGEEETASESVASLFKTVRELLEKHADARFFCEVALIMINRVIRPYTARWHGWMTEEKREFGSMDKPKSHFRDEQVRRTFRSELQQLRAKLEPYLQMIEKLAHFDPASLPSDVTPTIETVLGADLAARLKEDQETGKHNADLGLDLEAGIGTQVEIAGTVKPKEINRFEHWQITRRRNMWAGQNLAGEAEAPETQPPVTNATGLALSGGGIRSATFCLGIVQVLVRKGLLPQFDYLSTVSGGGYLGSFLSCALGTQRGEGKEGTDRDSAQKRIEDVFLRQEEQSRQKGIESALVRHLRNHSKYLLHGGFLGKMRIIGLLLSGLLWNVMIMLPIPLCAALLAYACGEWVEWLWDDSVRADRPALPPITGSISGWALVGLAGLLAVGWILLPAIQLVNHGKPPKSKGAKFRNWWEGATLRVGVATAAAGLLFLVPALFHAHEWLRTTLAQVRLGGLDWGSLAGLLPVSVTGAAGAVLAAIVGWLSPRWARLRSLAVKLLILVGPLLLLLVFLLVGNRLGIAREGGPKWNVYCVLGVTVGLTLWGWFCVNINTLAPHRYYRSRLCECYLARRIAKGTEPVSAREQKRSGELVQGSVEVRKQVKLSELGADLTAPYHLMNMTVNASTSKNRNLRGRGGDFFIASRHFYGSPLTGYAKTEELEKTDQHFDLGTAMAVSGAAASTSMGWQTLPHLRFLMALFNVRLSYWLTRPGEPARPWWLEGAGPWYLFREMIGWMDERCRYVNLSDGGHIENLAVYELLRRRCKFIVCVDGGCDPSLGCGDLIRLQRYAEIDLGVRMYFDTSDLEIGANGLSRAHAILVKIDYEPDPSTREEKGRCSDQLGWMLYVKLAMTGVEPNYVKDYQRENKDFPHQTTGDQIYDEAQFEAYRALGECATEGMFREELVGQQPPATVRAWFQCLANNLLPDNDEAFR